MNKIKNDKVGNKTEQRIMNKNKNDKARKVIQQRIISDLKNDFIKNEPIRTISRVMNYERLNNE